eukprot:8434226-Pyramimonas_sp.AAC.1
MSIFALPFCDWRLLNGKLNGLVYAPAGSEATLGVYARPDSYTSPLSPLRDWPALRVYPLSPHAIGPRLAGDLLRRPGLEHYRRGGGARNEDILHGHHPQIPVQLRLGKGSTRPLSP